MPDGAWVRPMLAVTATVTATRRETQLIGPGGKRNTMPLLRLSRMRIRHGTDRDGTERRNSVGCGFEPPWGPPSPPSAGYRLGLSTQDSVAGHTRSPLASIARPRTLVLVKRLERRGKVGRDRPPSPVDVLGHRDPGAA